MSPIHTTLAAGRWNTFSLREQLGNVGSEVGRAIKHRLDGNEDRADRAMERALELLDLTIADLRWRFRLRELTRARETLCDWFYGDNNYGSTPEQIERYFNAFAAARSLS